MRIADIISLNSKKSTGQKDPSDIPVQASEKDEGLQMRKLDAKKEVSSGEDKGIEELYQRYLAEASSIYDNAAEDFNLLPDRVIMQNLTMELVDKFLLCDIDIIKIFMKAPTENYLYNHSVNVTFLSVMLGVWLNYNKSDLNQLATAAILHDIGMVKVLRLVLLPRGLSPSERKAVARHPAYSREFTSRMPDMDNRVVEAVYNHHRRLGSSAGAIDEYSQIIGLADSFEAMTHSRAYKKPLEPHSAIRKIIEELKGMFDSNIIKALIDNIGIYPVGTWVRLDTDEIGLVIDVNSGIALSPKVNILFNKNEEPLPEPRTVDLSKQKNIHIKNPLEEEVERRLKEALS